MAELDKMNIKGDKNLIPKIIFKLVSLEDTK